MESAPQQIFSINISSNRTESPVYQTSVADPVRIASEKENGSVKITSHDSSRTEAGGGNVVPSYVMDVAVVEPKGDNKFASEIYITPAPSYSLCSRPPKMESNKCTDKVDARDADLPYSDTKAEIANRRSNFFSEITRCPVLPRTVSHSIVLNFQPTANILEDPSKQSQPEACSVAVTTNGHSEIALNMQPFCSEPGSETVQQDTSQASKSAEDAASVASTPDRRMSGEPKVIVHQAAPPRDSSDTAPLVLSISEGPVVLEVDDDVVPQFCARVEPSPERFWGPSVAPLQSVSSLRWLGNERLDCSGSELLLPDSSGHLEVVGRGTADRDESHRLGTSSTSSSSQESPLMKTAPKVPSGSTSTDSLPSTPSSANLSAHQKAGNLEKLRTFFGETAPKMFDSKAESPGAEMSPEPVSEEVLTESKKTEQQKLPSFFDIGGKSSSAERSFKNKKGGWSLSGKSHGTRSPGAKPKKTTERGDTGESPKHKQTWKGKMARTILRYGSGSVLTGADTSAPADTLGVIGVPLECCSPSPFNELVPLIVSACTRIVEDKGLLNQGIYRVPGNTGAINQLIEEMNKDPMGLCLDNEKWQDVNLVSSLLKLFFRKLPDSLITDELYESVIDANRLDNSTRRMLKLKKLLHELPEHNFETFHFLAQHLSRVASHEEVNKMDARNLAIVFGPTLVRPQDNNMVLMVKDMTDQCRIIESIVLHCDWFFGSWDEDVNVPIDDDLEELAPISGMNDELLAKAESLAITHHVSNKDVIQTIIRAANRKLRSRGKSKPVGSSGDFGSFDGSSQSTSVSKNEEETPDLDSPPGLCSALSEEVLLEVKKYPAYHFDEISFLCTENAKPRFRRARSNDFLADAPRVFCGDPRIRSMPRDLSNPFKFASTEDLEEFGDQDKRNYEGRRFAT